MSHQNKDAPSMRAMHTDISVHSKPIHLNLKENSLKHLEIVLPQINSIQHNKFTIYPNGESRGVFCGMVFVKNVLLKLMELIISVPA